MARHLHSKPLGELHYDAGEMAHFVAAVDRLEIYLDTLGEKDALRITVQGVMDGIDEFLADALADLRSDLSAVKKEIESRQPTGERERVADYYDYMART